MFHAVAGGTTGGNLFNLNWVELGRHRSGRDLDRHDGEGTAD